MKLLEITRNKKKKHNKIPKRKLNSIETLISQALIDLKINHKEFKAIVNEKEKYKKKKASIRNTKSSVHLSDNTKNIRENNGNVQN